MSQPSASVGVDHCSSVKPLSSSSRIRCSSARSATTSASVVTFPQLLECAFVDLTDVVSRQTLEESNLLRHGRRIRALLRPIDELLRIDLAARDDGGDDALPPLRIG